MPDSPPRPTRTLWLIIWGALTAAPIAYTVIAQVMAPSPLPPTELARYRMAFIGLATIAFGAGAFIMWRASAANGWPPVPSAPAPSANAPDLVPPAAFQLRSVIAMAFIESVAIYGFVLVTMGGPPQQIVPWTAASLAGMLAIVLPNGLSYWSRWELTSGGTPPAIG